MCKTSGGIIHFSHIRQCCITFIQLVLSRWGLGLLYVKQFDFPRIFTVIIFPFQSYIRGASDDLRLFIMHNVTSLNLTFIMHHEKPNHLILLKIYIIFYRCVIFHEFVLLCLSDVLAMIQLILCIEILYIKDL